MRCGENRQLYLGDQQHQPIPKPEKTKWKIVIKHGNNGMKKQNESNFATLTLLLASLSEPLFKNSNKPPRKKALKKGVSPYFSKDRAK